MLTSPGTLKMILFNFFPDLLQTYFVKPRGSSVSPHMLTPKLTTPASSQVSVLVSASLTLQHKSRSNQLSYLYTIIPSVPRYLPDMLMQMILI